MDFTTKRLKISEVAPSDIADIHRMNSYEKVAAFNTIGIPKDISETEILYQPLMNDKTQPERSLFGWTIRSQADDGFIGIAGLKLSAKKFKMGEIHYSIIPYLWGNGYATECVKAVINFGFEILKLHRIEAGVATENHHSVRVLEKVGMTKEGIRRKILPIRGEWYDNYHYAILEDDVREY
ncbi:MAG: GNAT family N-acetyltransferase [Bacteroidota bacterium]